MYGLMNRKGLMFSKINFVALILLFCISCGEDFERAPFSMYKLRGRAQGTTYTIQVYDSELNFNQKEIDSILFDFDMALSSYREGSLVSRFNALNFTDTSILSKSYFGQMLLLSDSIYGLSEGYFDPSVKPVMDLWGIGTDNEIVPTDSGIKTVLQSVGYRDTTQFKFRTLDGRMDISKLNSNFQLDFNAIAQGYSVDVLMGFLKGRGHENIYIELGGEIRLSGLKAGEKMWNIGIEKPSETNTENSQVVQEIITVSNCAIATSGNYRKYFEENGQRYAHTINPKTGKQNRHNLLSATVISSSCGRADAMATYFMVVGLEATKAYVDSDNGKGLDVYLIYSEDGEFKSFSTLN
jgi:thiamine biosynthesis lipoprotein